MARTARKTGMALVWHIAGLAWNHPGTARLRGGVVAASGAALAVAFATYNAADPSLNAASPATPVNALGAPGAMLADLGVQSLGLACAFVALTVIVLGLCRAAASDPAASRGHLRLRAAGRARLGVLALAAALAWPAPPAAWPLAKGLGGFWGDGLLTRPRQACWPTPTCRSPSRSPPAVFAGARARRAWPTPSACAASELRTLGDWLAVGPDAQAQAGRRQAGARRPRRRPQPRRRHPRRRARRRARHPGRSSGGPKVKPPKPAPKESPREQREAQSTFEFVKPGGFALPELSMLAKPKPRAAQFDEGALRQNAQLLESVLAEFGVKGADRPDPPGPGRHPLRAGPGRRREVGPRRGALPTTSRAR